VLPGVPDGLCSFEGGWESPLGPIEKVGGCFGWLDIPLCTACAVEAAGLSSLCGDADRCGVMTSGMGRLNPARLPTDALPSLDLVPAGVSGGECTADWGGEGRGEASTEPAGIALRIGVAEPDGTYHWSA